MLYSLFEYLAVHVYSGFHLFSYLTMRAILGVLTALVIALLVGPGMIKRLVELKIGQQVRSDGPQTHLTKAGTRTTNRWTQRGPVAAATLVLKGVMTKSAS